MKMREKSDWGDIICVILGILLMLSIVIFSLVRMNNITQSCKDLGYDDSVIGFQDGCVNTTHMVEMVYHDGKMKPVIEGE